MTPQHNFTRFNKNILKLCNKRFSSPLWFKFLTFNIKHSKTFSLRWQNEKRNFFAPTFNFFNNCTNASTYKTVLLSNSTISLTQCSRKLFCIFFQISAVQFSRLSRTRTESYAKYFSLFLFQLLQSERKTIFSRVLL